MIEIYNMGETAGGEFLPKTNPHDNQSETKPSLGRENLVRNYRIRRAEAVSRRRVQPMVKHAPTMGGISEAGRPLTHVDDNGGKNGGQQEAAVGAGTMPEQTASTQFDEGQAPQVQGTEPQPQSHDRASGAEHVASDAPEGMPVAPPTSEQVKDNGVEGESKQDSFADIAKELGVEPDSLEGKKIMGAHATIVDELSKDQPDLNAIVYQWAELKNEGEGFAGEISEKRIREQLEQKGVTPEEIEELSKRADEVKQGMPSPTDPEDDAKDKEEDVQNGGEEADQPLPGPMEGLSPTPRDLMAEAEEALRQGQEPGRVDEAIARLENIANKLKEGLHWAKTHKGTILMWTMIAVVVAYVYSLNKISGGVMKAGGNK